jgi:energy-converting hydrogenase Eha subunit A
LFLVPWLVRLLRAPDTVSWPVFILGIALLVLNFMGLVHVYLPKLIADPLTIVVMVAILCRLAVDLFPRDRASRP